jgi:beta-phosphoglucomutase-like phosphatase (HAD superfamily)/CTP:phosphocholine cytidylyltransferase-like protein
MNIIIPLCGIGKRFYDAGYEFPKPLIDVMDKKMIARVLDSIDLSLDDSIFIIYHTSLEEYGFSIYMKTQYPQIKLIPIYKRTDGAAETILYGIRYIMQHHLSSKLQTLLIDCDTIYHVPILEKLRGISTSATICFEDMESNPIYSYVRVEDGRIVEIKEKEKISTYANTGAYFFQNINELQFHCEAVIQKDLRYRNEYYISCVIQHMIDIGISFNAITINRSHYSSLGTPTELKQYLDRHRSFLFDLDGTLVKTDPIYLKVWKEILLSFNIPMTEYIFNQYIQGNNDSYAMKQLHIDPSSYNITLISTLKDTLFRKYLDEIIVIEGVSDYMKRIKEEGHSICIVTNCNRDTCIAILEHIGISKRIDHIIIGNECTRPKPYPDPYATAIRLLHTTADRCVIFEDSKSGLLSAKGVSPHYIVGVDNGTNRTILDELNIKTRITSYVNMSTHITEQTDSTCELREMIHRSVSNTYSIKHIHLDTNKLKGGYISDVIRVGLELESGEMIDCVLKYENDYTSSLTKMAYTLGLFDREYYFYEQIRDYVTICAPKYIGTIKNSEYLSKGVLLENINKEDFVLGLNLNEENIDVSLKVIEQCAVFHSQFWNKDLSKSFPQLKKHNDPLFKPVWGEFLRERWPLFSEKWKHIIPSNTLAKLEGIVGRFEEIQDEMSSGHLTICHGDVKSGNIFYKKQGSGYMPYFIDWQYVANGKGVQDIVFFMMESFSIENIHAYRDLFKMYYYIKLKENGVIYPWEIYHKDFEQAMCYFPLFVAVWFGTTPNEELIDVSFPFLFIKKFVAIVETLHD